MFIFRRVSYLVTLNMASSYGSWRNRHSIQDYCKKTVHLITLMGITRVSSTPNERTTEAKATEFWHLQHKKFQSKCDHYKQMCCYKILSLLGVNLWAMQQFWCCTIYSIYLDFIMCLN